MWAKCWSKFANSENQNKIATFRNFIMTTKTTDVGWAAPRARRVALGLKSKVLRAGPPNPLPGGVKARGGFTVTSSAVL